MSRLASAWDRFWFAPRSMAPFELLRAAFGLLAALWALSLLSDATTFFGPGGVLQDSPSRLGGWSVLDVWHSDVAVVLLVVLLLVAGLCLLADLAVRPAAAAAFIALVSLGERNPFVGNSGDGLLRALSFYVLLGSFVRRDRGWTLRLIQVQFSLIYLATVWAKLRGTDWPGGTAVAYAFRLEDLARFAAPDVGGSLLLTHALSYGVLIVEASLGALVWVRRLRPWVLLAGVALHLGIEYRLRVGFFSWTILALYLVWLPPYVAERVLALRPRLRSRLWRASGSTQ